MVETDFGQASHRGEHDEIVFEMNNRNQNKDKLSDEYRFTKNGSKVRQRKRNGGSTYANSDDPTHTEN